MEEKLGMRHSVWKMRNMIMHIYTESITKTNKFLQLFLESEKSKNGEEKDMDEINLHYISNGWTKQEDTQEIDF